MLLRSAKAPAICIACKAVVFDGLRIVVMDKLLAGRSLQWVLYSSPKFGLDGSGRRGTMFARGQASGMKTG